MDRFYVYCHVRKTDGKCFYIGKGTGNRAKSTYKRNQYWNKIVDKHGFETIILVNNISEEKAFELEADFCKQIGYKNLCNLNQEKGWGGHSKSEETKLKLSVPRPNSGNKGPMSEEHKQKLCIPRPSSGFRGIRPEKTRQKMRKPKKFSKRSPMSDETKQKIGNANKGPNENLRKAKFKPILQYDKQGNFIKEWNSILEAKKQYKGDIQRCCTGKSKTSCEFIWKYKI